MPTAARRVCSRACRALLLCASAAVGAAAATAAVLLSGPSSALGASPGWPVSALLVGAVAAAWFSGIALALLHAVAGARPSRPDGWLIAFGLAPFALALFFFLVSVGVNGGTGRGYLTAAAVLCLALLCRRQLPAMSEKLLVAFFAWLALLILPALCADPVNRLVSEFLLAMLRKSGVVA